jgi:hypothetical protein
MGKRAVASKGKMKPVMKSVVQVPCNCDSIESTAIAYRYYRLLAFSNLNDDPSSKKRIKRLMILCFAYDKDLAFQET